MTIQFGGNSDEYLGRDKPWLLAGRHNKQSLQMHGAVTVRRRREVKSTKQLPLT